MILYLNQQPKHNNLVFRVRNIISTARNQVVILIGSHASAATAVGICIRATLRFKRRICKHGQLPLRQRDLLRSAV